MEACNAYYYATRDPLGARGDFTTAPEISQMFGELVGAALADCWTRAGAPDGRDLCRARAGPRNARRAMRCGCCARRASPARCIWSRPARCCARRRQQARARTRHGTRPIDDLPREAAAAGRQRIPRRAADPPVRRRDRAARDRSPPAGWRSTATARSSKPRRRATKRSRDRRDRLARNGGAALIIDYGHASSAPGRHAAGGARPSLRAGARRSRASRT